MGRFRNTIFLVLLALIFIQVLLIFPRQVDRKEPEPQSSSRSKKDKEDQVGPAEQKIQGLHLVESQKGTRDWELFAEAAEGSQGQGSWNLKTVRILFYNQEKVDFTVVGATGSIDGKTKNIKIRGDVVTKSTNGYVFRTEEADYQAQARRLQSPGRVQMEAPPDQHGSGMVVTGEKMLVMVDESRMFIQKDVKARKALREGHQFELTGESAEFSGQNREARFSGQVIMQYDRTRLEGPVAFLRTQNAGELLSHIEFEGGVKASDVDKFATSEKLNLDLVRDQMTFMGSPRVFQNNDELSGERIIFLNGGKKVKVERVRANVEKPSSP